jgi:hypothetical protein
LSYHRERSENESIAREKYQALLESFRLKKLQKEEERRRSIEASSAQINDPNILRVSTLKTFFIRIVESKFILIICHG